MKKVGKTNKPIMSVSEKFLSRVQFFANSWTVGQNNRRVGSLSLLQGIFPTQVLNPGLLHFKWILHQLTHKGSPWYDLNQISYGYTVEVTNRFKELDLIDRVPEELGTEVHNTVQDAVIKIIPMKKKCKKAKWLSEEASKIAEKRGIRMGKTCEPNAFSFQCMTKFTTNKN